MGALWCFLLDSYVRIYGAVVPGSAVAGYTAACTRTGTHTSSQTQCVQSSPAGFKQGHATFPFTSVPGTGTEMLGARGPPHNRQRMSLAIIITRNFAHSGPVLRFQFTKKNCSSTIPNCFVSTIDRKNC